MVVPGLLLLLSLSDTFFALDCSKAPTPALKIICGQISRWDTSARTTPAVSTSVQTPGISGKAMAAEFSPIASNVHQCMDIACLCVFFRGTGGANCQVGGRPLGKAVRKEYRQMTDDERNRLHAAFWSIKNSGEYDRLARVHAQYSNSGAAHSGPAFLPWHREFVKRMEFSLRQVDPTLYLPYWDSTLDQNLPTPKDSIIWTNEFMGESDASGRVMGGPFRSWTTIENHPAITRKVGAEAKLFSEDEINFVLGQTDIAQVLAFSAPKQGCRFQPNFNVLEYTHGNPHIFVGGDMFETSTAANDPIFWMHHSFVDHIWELYRLNRQSRYVRETAYPADDAQCSSEHHFRNAFMRPFTPLKNFDGLSNMYTDNLYSYSQRPSCNQGPNCGSKYLFCDRSHGAPRCASLIKPGGNCAGFNAGESPCYNGVCQGGKCVGGTQVTPPPRIVPTKPAVAVQTSCFNEHECCQPWASKGECNKNPIYMYEWCKASCAQCVPPYNLNEECSDRHQQCSGWAAKGECTKNPLWMSENCRKSCQKCGVTRMQSCGFGGGGGAAPQNQQQQPTQSRTQLASCESKLCFNEDVCCAWWAQNGECQKNPGFMGCECKISCGTCRPSFAFGQCNDYHKDCASWAAKGECNKNKWMLENCRTSCRSCMTPAQLSQRCGTRRARSILLSFM